MDWEPAAFRLAEQVTHSASRWRPVVAAIPRHLFVPNWWIWDAVGSVPYGDLWIVRDGPADEDVWLHMAYRNRSLVTRVGSHHADHATSGDRPSGRPTSSATMPGLIVQLARHAYLFKGADVLDVGTGSGYGTAVLARRLGAEHVTSVDVDAYLTGAATGRLDAVGLHPKVVTCDATGPLPGTYDRIISTVSVPAIPSSWLAALRPGGRFVTTITGTGLIITADKTDDGGAIGRTEWDRAGFMATRTGPDYPPPQTDLFGKARAAEGDQIHTGRFPVVDVMSAWELWSMLTIQNPGIEHHFERADDGTRIALMVHPDGSWARATSTDDGNALVHQGGPRLLWDDLDGIRTRWLMDGSLPVYGATVTVAPDGTCHLKRGKWQASIE